MVFELLFLQLVSGKKIDVNYFVCYVEHFIFIFYNCF